MSEIAYADKDKQFEAFLEDIEGPEEEETVEGWCKRWENTQRLLMKWEGQYFELDEENRHLRKQLRYTRYVAICCAISTAILSFRLANCE